MLRVVLEEPFAPLDERGNRIAQLRWTAGVLDRALEVVHDLGMERPHQQTERLLSSVRSGIGAKHRNRTAQAVVLQNQLEAFPGMHPFLKGDVNRCPKGLLRLRRVEIGNVE